MGMRSNIRHWLDLASLAEELAGEEWVFRGEASGDNPLRPGAGRLGRSADGERDEALSEEDERAALTRFKNDALPHVSITPRIDRDLEWLAIAQHYGMKTRLLDWTESLLIAAFFAVESSRSTRGVIYGVKGLPIIDSTVDPFTVDDVCVYRPSRIAPRIAPQWSVFTIHPRPSEDFRSSGRVRKWVIHGRETCRRIKLILDFCGINYASIFPDLEGLARHIYWRHSRGMSQASVAPRGVSRDGGTVRGSGGRRRGHRGR